MEINKMVYGFDREIKLVLSLDNSRFTDNNLNIHSTDIKMDTNNIPNNNNNNNTNNNNNNNNTNNTNNNNNNNGDNSSINSTKIPKGTSQHMSLLTFHKQQQSKTNQSNNGNTTHTNNNNNNNGNTTHNQPNNTGTSSQPNINPGNTTHNPPNINTNTNPTPNLHPNYLQYIQALINQSQSQGIPPANPLPTGHPIIPNNSPTGINTSTPINTNNIIPPPITTSNIPTQQQTLFRGNTTTNIPQPFQPLTPIPGNTTIPPPQYPIHPSQFNINSNTHTTQPQTHTPTQNQYLFTDNTPTIDPFKFIDILYNGKSKVKPLGTIDSLNGLLHIILATEQSPYDLRSKIDGVVKGTYFNNITKLVAVSRPQLKSVGSLKYFLYFTAILNSLEASKASLSLSFPLLLAGLQRITGIPNEAVITAIERSMPTFRQFNTFMTTFSQHLSQQQSSHSNKFNNYNPNYNSNYNSNYN